MRHVDYNAPDAGSSTATHRGVDEVMEDSLKKGSSADGSVGNSYREGFAASSGIRPEAAETGGRAHAPEAKDKATPDPVPTSLEKENAGLADR